MVYYSSCLVSLVVTPGWSLSLSRMSATIWEVLDIRLSLSPARMEFDGTAGVHGVSAKAYLVYGSGLPRELCEQTQNYRSLNMQQMSMEVG